MKKYFAKIFSLNLMKTKFAKPFFLILMTVLLVTLLLMTVSCAMFQGSGAADTSAGSSKDTPGSSSAAPSATAAASFTAKLSAQKITAFPDAFVSGINQYGWIAASRLYDGSNLAISPASLELALLMTRAGASGATADEMKTALSMSDLSDEDILSSCKQLMWRLNTSGMEASDSIWMQSDYSFSDAFIKSCTDSFMADAFSVNFLTDSAGATDLINKWVSDKTNGKIPLMNPEPLSSDTRLVLINALYFLGDWTIPFEAADTYDQMFHGTKKETSVKFMHSNRDMLYCETPSYQMISLPFSGPGDKSDSTYSMAFILPAQGQDTGELMNALASGGFASAVDSLAGSKVRLSLPKFEFTFDTSMVSTMQSLGMKLAFDIDNARFDKMTGAPNDLSISDILHKCYIRVDEEGAEAAAVTEVIMTEAAAQIDDDAKIFTADRPFLFAIYDETDHTVLFLGAVGQL